MQPTCVSESFCTLYRQLCSCPYQEMLTVSEHCSLFSSGKSCEATHPAASAYHIRKACEQALQAKLPRSENSKTSNAITAILM